ncbi:alpha/beta hydrolase [Metapseudomonas resinovorans]|uniref:alpha/beta hydrolase n=1 Tax=Metapseudomonas resinovorans TaxID=53412 RepID=UPI00041DF445|nr:alpha/beta hydrolase-fold protein [Pseudomonas resinovorans]
MRQLLLVLLCCWPWLSEVQARPDLDKAVAPGVAEQGSAYYRFQSLVVTSADGLRGYQVRIGIPRRLPSAAGYPVIYLLDGNAAIEALREEWLAELDRADPPVLVAIGHAGNRRFDVAMRTYDYTPPMGVEPIWDDLEQTRRAGGAEQFLGLIETRLKPQVAELAPIDPGRQALWGHSYGGLFVLYSLFSRPDAFQSYAAASPSLWWRDGYLLQLEKRFGGLAAGQRARLLMTKGDAEQSSRVPANAAERERRLQRESVPPEAARELARRLGQWPGLVTRYIEFPGLGHGPALAASLLPALRMAAGVSLEHLEVQP